MKFDFNDPVRVREDVTRKGQLYAKKGDKGVILQIYECMMPNSSPDAPPVYEAEVLMENDEIKKFRFGSLELDEPTPQ